MEMEIRDLSESLIAELALRDELEYEKELKNQFISLLLSIQNKKRHLGVSASHHRQTQKGGERHVEAKSNGNTPLKTRGKPEPKVMSVTYWTSVISSNSEYCILLFFVYNSSQIADSFISFFFSFFNSTQSFISETSFVDMPIKLVTHWHKLRCVLTSVCVSNVHFLILTPKLTQLSWHKKLASRFLSNSHLRILNSELTQLSWKLTFISPVIFVSYSKL